MGASVTKIIGGFIVVAVVLSVLVLIFTAQNDLHMQAVDACIAPSGERFIAANTTAEWDGENYLLSEGTAADRCAIAVPADGTAITATTVIYTPKGDPFVAGVAVEAAASGDLGTKVSWEEALPVVQERSSLNRLVISALPLVLVGYGAYSLVNWWRGRKEGMAA